jgi:hypothetical protein
MPGDSNQAAMTQLLLLIAAQVVTVAIAGSLPHALD